jgi:hypothetical protein
MALSILAAVQLPSIRALGSDLCVEALAAVSVLVCVSVWTDSILNFSGNHFAIPDALLSIVVEFSHDIGFFGATCQCNGLGIGGGRDKEQQCCRREKEKLALRKERHVLILV